MNVMVEIDGISTREDKIVRMDIERLVEWSFADQKVDGAMATALSSFLPGISPTGALARYLEIGDRIDGTGRGAQACSARADEDALLIYVATIGLAPEVFSLVAMHARNGNRPEWHPEGPGRMVKRINKRGEIAKIWADPRNCRGWIGCQLMFEGTDPVLVDFARHQYGMWWRGLKALAETLAGRLARFDVVGPLVPEYPWLRSGRVLPSMEIVA